MCASVYIFLIALMAQSGLAIKCFTCDSENNPLCANMTDPNLIAEECQFEKQRDLEAKFYNNNNRHWLLRISDYSNHVLKNEFDAKMVCQKLIGYDEKKQKTIVRRCQLENINSCTFSRQLTVNLNREVECYICNVDGCNGSSRNQVYSAMIGLVSAVAIFKHFLF